MIKPRAHRTNRKSLRFESLEERSLLAVTISASDAMIPETSETSVLVSPGAGGLSAPRELTIGPDGNLYVASANTNSILRYNSSTGQFITTFVPSNSGGLTGPAGVAFGPDGDLYVSSTATDSILHYRGPTKSNSGSFVNAFVPAGSGGLDNPSGLAFGSDGNLYVASRSTSEVLRFRGPLSATPGSGLPSPGNSGATFVAQSSGSPLQPLELAFGPDGNLYVSSQSMLAVLRFDSASGNLIDEFVSQNEGNLVLPRGIEFDQEGRLYIVDNGTGAIHRYDTQGQLIDDIVVPGVSGLAAPAGLAFDSQGALFISNGIYSSIARYNHGFTLTLSAASPTPVSVSYATVDNSADQSDYHSQSGVVSFLPGQTSRRILLATKDDLQIESNEIFSVQLSNPIGATVLQSSASVTITDDDAGRQVVIADGTESEGDRTGHFRGTFAAGLPGYTSHNVTFGPDGNLYTSPGPGPTKNRINRYDGITGEFIDEFIAAGRIDGVRDIRFRAGYVYVGSEYTDEVLRFNAATGAFVDAFVTAGSGGLGGTHGMDFGPDFNGDGIPELYVAGRDSFTVGRFDGATGAPLGTYVAPGSGGLSYPEGLTFDPTKTFLYVASEGTNQVLKYNAVTGAFVGVAASSNISNVHDVKFGTDGLLYVASGDNNRILRFNPAGAYVDDFVPAGSGGLSKPARMEFGPDGSLYVAMLGNSNILRYGTESEVVLNVTISSASGLPVTVNYSTASDSAASGIDFTPVSGVLSFPPGVTSKTITIPILDDLAFEPNETFTVNLSNPMGGVISDGQGVATILANDFNLGPTKFYVVDDASQNRTYEYKSNGELVESYSITSANSAPRGAASNVAGDKVWVVDANRNVYVYNTSGGLLGSWTARTLPGNATIEGIATNGTDVWIVDARGDRVYRYAGAASRTSGSQHAASSFRLDGGNSVPKDIVTDGQHLWVVNDASTDGVFKYTVGGQFVGSWTIDPANRSPTGLTLDPANPQHIWIVDSGTDRVYQYNSAASRTSGTQTSATSFALAAGNTNPQGIADPPSTAQVVVPANSSVAADIPTLSTSVPRRAYSPIRRPTHSTITKSPTPDDLNLLARANLTAERIVVDGKLWQVRAISAKAALFDAALEELDYSAWPEFLAGL